VLFPAGEYTVIVGRDTLLTPAPKFDVSGYWGLAIDLEGTEVCDWLMPKGITCVLLKYRVPPEKGYPKSAPYPKSGPYPESPMALEDAQRTLGLLRLNARSTTSIPARSEFLGFRQVGISQQR
jgi:hypothetical protein